MWKRLNWFFLRKHTSKLGTSYGTRLDANDEETDLSQVAEDESPPKSYIKTT